MIKILYGIYVQYSNVDDPYLRSLWESKELAEKEFNRLIETKYYSDFQLDIQEVYLNSRNLEYNSND